MYEFEKLHRLPFNEFTTDAEYQKSMDSAWHNWLKNYPEQFKAWEAGFTAMKVNSPRAGTKQSEISTSIPDDV